MAQAEIKKEIKRNHDTTVGILIVPSDNVLYAVDLENRGPNEEGYVYKIDLIDCGPIFKRPCPQFKVGSAYKAHVENEALHLILNGKSFGHSSHIAMCPAGSYFYFEDGERCRRGEAPVIKWIPGI